MFDRYCIYCDNKLDEADTTCRICGAKIEDETCFKKKFNHVPLIKGLIAVLILRIILELLFAFIPFKTFIAILIGCIYTGRSYGEISPLSLAIGGAMGLAVMIISHLLISANGIDFAAGFVCGLVGMAVGSYLKR